MIKIDSGINFDKLLQNLVHLELKIIKSQAIQEATSSGTDDIVDRLFSMTEEEIDKSWDKIIKFEEMILHQLKKCIKKHSKEIIINMKFDNIQASFSGMKSLNMSNVHIQQYKSIEDLYKAIIDSYDVIFEYINNGYSIQKMLLEKFHNNIYSDNYLSTVNESISLFDFDIHYLPFLSEKQEHVAFIGEELFNELFIENATVFNGISLQGICNEQKFQVKVYEKFLNELIYNISELTKPGSDYSKKDEELTKRGKIRNEMLNLFIKTANNTELSVSRSINLYSMQFFDLNDEDSLKRLGEILQMIVLKSKVMTEAIFNMLKLDAIAVHCAEQDSVTEIREISIHQLRKVRDILDKNSKSIFKHNRCYLDFSKYNLGSVCLSATARNSNLDKLIDPEYCTALLYFIGSYDYTIISHGGLDQYRSLYNFITSYRKSYPIEYDLFKKCYEIPINIISQLCNNTPFDSLSEDQCNHIDSLFSSDTNLRRITDNVSVRSILKDFHFRCHNRWVCDPVYIPFIKKEIEDVEMIIYTMNINKVKSLAVYICNEARYIPSGLSISTYPDMEVKIPDKKVMK